MHVHAFNEIDEPFAYGHYSKRDSDIDAFVIDGMVTRCACGDRQFEPFKKWLFAVPCEPFICASMEKAPC
jgi:hypothetical protein